MPETLYSTHDCAKLLGIEEHRITYAQRKGTLPEPTFFVAGKRIYTADDLADIAKFFGIKPPLNEMSKCARSSAAGRKEAGE